MGAMHGESWRTLRDMRTRFVGSTSAIRPTNATTTRPRELELEGAASRGRLIPFARMPGVPVAPGRG
jgi:hypothetical protein